MNRYTAVLVIEAESYEDAEHVLAERIGYDEDLSEEGVGDYAINAGPLARLDKAALIEEVIA